MAPACNLCCRPHLYLANRHMDRAQMRGRMRQVPDQSSLLPAAEQSSSAGTLLQDVLSLQDGGPEVS